MFIIIIITIIFESECKFTEIKILKISIKMLEVSKDPKLITNITIIKIIIILLKIRLI